MDVIFSTCHGLCSPRNVQRLDDGHGNVGPRGARAFGLGSPGDVALLQSGVPWPLVISLREKHRENVRDNYLGICF